MRKQLANLTVLASALLLCHTLAHAQSVCCVLPEAETITAPGTLQTTYSDFLQEIPNGNFNGVYVQEIPDTKQGTNTCYWATSGLQQYPVISSGEWGVGIANPPNAAGQPTVGPTPAPQIWGYDVVGYSTTLIKLIRQQGPQNGITITVTTPCVDTTYQTMQIQCEPDSGWQTYQTHNVLTTQVFLSGKIINTRRDGSDIIYY